MCVRSKDAGRFLPEWIAYHYAIGVDEITVYDDNSIDQTKEVWIMLHVVNAFTAGNPFWGTKLLEVSTRKDFGVQMGLRVQQYCHDPSLSVGCLYSVAVCPLECLCNLSTLMKKFSSRSRHGVVPVAPIVQEFLSTRLVELRRLPAIVPLKLLDTYGKSQWWD